MKQIFILIALAWSISMAAQDTVMNKVPKQMSLEAGYVRIISSELGNPASNGYTVLFDYAWQLSGFAGKRSAFISVPLGYTQFFPDSDTGRSVRMINYGWTVRHELRPQAGLVPFIGYGLMLNQYSEKDIKGRRFGHQTRFSLGVNYYNSSCFQPYIQLDYSMVNYPQWGIKGSLGKNYLEIKVGARFMRGRINQG